MKAPAPYCSKNMLAMLRNLNAGKGCEVAGLTKSTTVTTFAALKSRGWISSAGQVTDEGRRYLASRE